MIHLSPSAIQELNRLRQRQSNLTQPIYLTLDPGGCAQWAYRINAEPLSDGATTTFDCGSGLTLVVDDTALDLVRGLTIDYSEDLMGGGFRFTNPQAHHTCGCGHSFSTTPEPTTSDCTATPPPATFESHDSMAQPI
ncbi:iron-sulfur cluster assembly accessory protein [Nodosilinea sp. P-1105]|uniref:HesB/IscA family protein n=1 Tax=Nodosilinea sp. P-1105 TaxID=2546229 RepID=UPI00146C371D|nr:iron-sulfur cluster assembly accessory protein [Nodosilinea sp. P-1105]NMF83872.1 iron-sulfur cluster assembly accessory protein [Nodosilinea sp. P-1105]